MEGNICSNSILHQNGVSVDNVWHYTLFNVRTLYDLLEIM